MLATIFAAAMARCGPFEPEPELAVAVSGGADSLALTLLADEWARARGGRITALTVDHGLRPAAAAEARRVGRWLKARGIRHRILRWSPPGRPAGTARLANLQAAARDGRYERLCRWCGDHHVLHLLLAHHQEDQAETFLLRLARGSGVTGLAAMAPLAVRDGVRLLRPLLAVSKSQLTACLEERRQPWIDDPSNQDTANARVRWRQMMPRLAREGLTAQRLAETAGRLSQARAAIDAAVDRLLGKAASVYPEGYLRLDTALLVAAEREIGLRALARALACIGGADYGPRLERLTRLYEVLRAPAELGGGKTLGGCRILPLRDQAERAASAQFLILREPAAVAPAIRLNADAPVRWDGRFSLARSGGTAAQREFHSGEISLGALGESGWRRVWRIAERRNPAVALPPRDVILTLPALRRRGTVLAVPQLGYFGGAKYPAELRRIKAWRVHFTPRSPLTRPGFTLV